MKITAEFNSTGELLNFINTFGTTNLAPIQGVIKTVNVPEVEVNTKKSIGGVFGMNCMPAKEAEVNAPKEDIKEAILAKEAEIANELEQDQKKDEETKVTKVTKEDLRAIFTKIIKAGKQSEAKALTTKYGAARLPDIKEEDYAAVYKDAEDLI